MINNQKILIDLKRHLKHHYGDSIKNVVLFGSQARGDSSEYSDYDILIVLDKDYTGKDENKILDLCYDIDLIINLSKPIKYEKRTKEHLFQNTHFSGIQNNHRIITQKGPLDVVGISFQPTGFYPLIKIPLSEFANNMIPIENLISGFERKVERIAETKSIWQKYLP